MDKRVRKVLSRHLLYNPISSYKESLIDIWAVNILSQSNPEANICRK